MGAYSNLLEGISKFDALIEAYANKPSAQKAIRVGATDEQGNYHDPETHAHWQAEAEKGINDVVPVKHKTADQITVLEAEYLSVANCLGMLASATAGVGPDQVAKLADKADWEASKAVMFWLHAFTFAAMGPPAVLQSTPSRACARAPIRAHQHALRRNHEPKGECQMGRNGFRFNLPRWAVMTARHVELLEYLRRVEHVRNSQRPPTPAYIALRRNYEPQEK